MQKRYTARQGVLNVIFFLLGNSPASEFDVPIFRNTLSVPSSYVVQAYTAYEDGTERFETLTHKIQKPGNHAKEIIQQNTSPSVVLPYQDVSTVIISSVCTTCCVRLNDVNSSSSY